MNLQMLPSPEAQVTVELSSDCVNFLQPDGNYRDSLLVNLEGPLYSDSKDLMYERIIDTFPNLAIRPTLELDDLDKRELRSKIRHLLGDVAIRFSNDYRGNLGRSFEFEQIFDVISIKIKVEINHAQADNKMTQVKQVEVINVQLPTWANIQVTMKGKMIDFIMGKGIWQTEVDTKLSVRPLDEEDYTALEQLEAYIGAIGIGPINNDAIPENEAAVPAAESNLKAFMKEFAKEYNNRMLANYYGEFGLKKSFPEFDIEFTVIPEGQELIIPEPPKLNAVVGVRVRAKDIFIVQDELEFRELVFSSPVVRINGEVDITNVCDWIYSRMDNIGFAMDGDDEETLTRMNDISKQYRSTFDAAVNFVHNALSREKFSVPIGNYSYNVGGLMITVRLVK